MHKKIGFFLLLVVILVVGCTNQIGGYEAAYSISKKGFTKNLDSFGEMEGQVVQLWGYVDQGNIYGDEETKMILGDWWSGYGPSSTKWQFNLKARSNDKTGESFAVIVQNDEGRDDLLRAFLADANAQKATKVFLRGRISTFDASSNLQKLQGIILEVQSSNDILLELP